MDKIVKEAINKVVKNENQNEQLAERLWKWIDGLSVGNDGFDSKEDIYRHIDTILNSIKSSDTQVSEGDD